MFSSNKLKTAEKSLFGLDYRIYSDYLSDEDRKFYDKPQMWDEMRMKVAEIICGRD